MEKIQNKKLIVISKDAGGAEILASYLYNNKSNFDAVLDNPAKKIFLKKFSKLKIVSTKKMLKNLNLYSEAYLGTGLKKYEVKILSLIKNKIKTTSFVDHWCFYKERFKLKNKVYVYPDIINAHDTSSYNILKKNFRNSQVLMKSNPYWQEQLDKYYKKNKKIDNQFLLLLPNFNEKNFSLKELNIFFKNFYLLDYKKKFLIRLHPNTKFQKLRESLKYLKFLNYKISNDKDLGYDFSKSKIVIGYKSSALGLSNKFGIKTFSFLKRKNINIPSNIKIKYFDYKNLNKISILNLLS